MKFIEVCVICFGIIVCGLLIYLAEQADRHVVPCALLMGGWHPDVQKNYAEQCALAQKERSDR